MMDNEMLNLPILPIMENAGDIIDGSLNCSTATVFSVMPNAVVQISFANPSNTDSVKYAVYNNNTNTRVTSGTLSPGKSASITIPFSAEVNSYRIQNQSPCGRTGTTPKLQWSAVRSESE